MLTTCIYGEKGREGAGRGGACTFSRHTLIGHDRVKQGERVCGNGGGGGLVKKRTISCLREFAMGDVPAIVNSSACEVDGKTTRAWFVW